MENIITINETATLNVMPDTVVVTINIKGRDKEYNHAVELATLYLAEVTDCLAEQGVQRDSIKTDTLNVAPIYDYNKNKVTLNCYECSFLVRLEFEYNSEHLAKIVSAISMLDAQPKLHVDFKLAYQIEAEAKLIDVLAEKARHKANLLCKAAGVSLGKLIKIEYTGNDGGGICFTSYARGANHASDADSIATFAASITPKEIVLRENASFYWEIN